MSRHTTPRRTARLLPVVAAALAVALSGCGSDDDSAATIDPTTSASPSASASDEPVVLTADGSNAGKCAMPSAEVLSTFDTAFEGTVTSVDGGAATLEVDQWYVGGDASTVTVDASPPAYHWSTSSVAAPPSTEVTVPSKAVSNVARISAEGIAHLPVLEPSAVRTTGSSEAEALGLGPRREQGRGRQAVTRGRAAMDCRDARRARLRPRAGQ